MFISLGSTRAEADVRIIVSSAKLCLSFCLVMESLRYHNNDTFLERLVNIFERYLYAVEMITNVTVLKSVVPR